MQIYIIFSIANSESDFVPDSCPWYEQYLKEARDQLWEDIHQYDDPPNFSVTFKSKFLESKEL